MKKIAEFFNKWGLTTFLGLVAIALLFALGCTIYTSIINPFVGIVGMVGTIMSLGGIAFWMYLEINAQKNDTSN